MCLKQILLKAGAHIKKCVVNLVIATHGWFDYIMSLYDDNTASFKLVKFIKNVRLFFHDDDQNLLKITIISCKNICCLNNNLRGFFLEYGKPFSDKIRFA